MRRLLGGAAIGVVALVLAATAAMAGPPRDIESTCPPPDQYVGTDVDPDSPHWPAFYCAFERGITELTGQSDVSTYEPNQSVRRDQMAIFVLRTLNVVCAILPAVDTDQFDDDDGNIHEDAIDILAFVEIVNGVGDRRYDPSEVVTRAAMATFLDNAYRYQSRQEELPPGPDAFGDDNGSRQERAINRLAAAGVITGYGDGSYRPDRPVSRAEMASFLIRTLDLMIDNGLDDCVPVPPATA